MSEPSSGKPRMGIAPPPVPTQNKQTPTPLPRKSIDVSAVKSKFESPPANNLSKENKSSPSNANSTTNSNASSLKSSSSCVGAQDKLCDRKLNDRQMSDGELRRSLRESKPVIQNFLEGLTAEIKSDSIASKKPASSSTSSQEKTVFRFKSTNPADKKATVTVTSEKSEGKSEKSRKSSQSTFYVQEETERIVLKSGKSTFFVEEEREEIKSTLKNDTVVSSTVVSHTKKSYTHSGDTAQAQPLDTKANNSHDPVAAQSPKVAKKILLPPKSPLSPKPRGFDLRPSPEKPSTKPRNIPIKPAQNAASETGASDAEEIKPVAPLRRKKQVAQSENDTDKEFDSKSRMRIISFTTEDTDIFESKKVI